MVKGRISGKRGTMNLIFFRIPDIHSRNSGQILDRPDIRTNRILNTITDRMADIRTSRIQYLISDKNPDIRTGFMLYLMSARIPDIKPDIRRGSILDLIPDRI